MAPSEKHIPNLCTRNADHAMWVPHITTLYKHW